METLMTDRDEPAADILIREAAHILAQKYPINDESRAIMRFVADDYIDAILTRWRLVPVEPTGPCGAINPDTGDVCALTTGHARHHLSAAQRDEIRQRSEQHRAADELTQHDQDAGIYGDTCQCGEGAEHSPRTHP